MSEQLQVVAFLTKPDFCEPYVGLHRDSMTTGTSEPLMTVAQHERIVAAKDAEIARLRGLTPELPPRPPEGDGLPRYGLRWNGPAQPLATPFNDGYWTPWHLAQAEIQRLSAQPARQVGVGDPKVPNYKFKFETLVEHCKRQDQVISELRYDENIRRFYDEGAVWFWCGDESDNLATLACPVVINAGDLRALLGKED